MAYLDDKYLQHATETVNYQVPLFFIVSSCSLLIELTFDHRKHFAQDIDQILLQVGAVTVLNDFSHAVLGLRVHAGENQVYVYYFFDADFYYFLEVLV